MPKEEQKAEQKVRADQRGRDSRVREGRNKARLIRDAFVGKEFPMTVPTPNGEVVLGAVEYHEDETHGWIEVRLGGKTEGGEPHFRIFNPPTHIPAGRGSKEDPILAIAYAVGGHGGVRKKGRSA